VSYLFEPSSSLQLGDVQGIACANESVDRKELIISIEGADFFMIFNVPHEQGFSSSYLDDVPPLLDSLFDVDVRGHHL
jgi:hypothetical protein